MEPLAFTFRPLALRMASTWSSDPFTQYALEENDLPSSSEEEVLYQAVISFKYEGAVERLTLGTDRHVLKAIQRHENHLEIHPWSKIWSPFIVSVLMIQIVLWSAILVSDFSPPRCSPMRHHEIKTEHFSAVQSVEFSIIRPLPEIFLSRLGLLFKAATCSNVITFAAKLEVSIVLICPRKTTMAI